MGFSMDFAREFEDKESIIKDVTLIGSDRGRVSATKAILAIRSAVFRRMFFGNFRESKQDCNSVTLGYTTPVIRELVKFCYTNEISIRVKDARSVTVLGSLLEAGMYFEMSELLRVTVNWDKSIVFILLQELFDRGVKGGKLWKMCIENLFGWIPRVLFSLKPQLVWLRVSVLRIWYNDHAAKWQVSGQDHLDPVAEDEKLRLQKLADDTVLEKLPQARLADMKPCPLFPLERLHKALVQSIQHSSSKPQYYSPSPSPAYRPSAYDD